MCYLLLGRSNCNGSRRVHIDLMPLARTPQAALHHPVTLAMNASIATAFYRFYPLFLPVLGRPLTRVRVNTRPKSLSSLSYCFWSTLGLNGRRGCILGFKANERVDHFEGISWPRYVVSSLLPRYAQRQYSSPTLTISTLNMGETLPLQVKDPKTPKLWSSLQRHSTSDFESNVSSPNCAASAPRTRRRPSPEARYSLANLLKLVRTKALFGLSRGVAHSLWFLCSPSLFIRKLENHILSANLESGAGASETASLLAFLQSCARVLADYIRYLSGNKCPAAALFQKSRAQFLELARNTFQLVDFGALGSASAQAPLEKLGVLSRYEASPRAVRARDRPPRSRALQPHPRNRESPARGDAPEPTAAVAPRGCLSGGRDSKPGRGGSAESGRDARLPRSMASGLRGRRPTLDAARERVDAAPDAAARASYLGTGTRSKASGARGREAPARRSAWRQPQSGGCLGDERGGRVAPAESIQRRRSRGAGRSCSQVRYSALVRSDSRALVRSDTLARGDAARRDGAARAFCRVTRSGRVAAVLAGPAQAGDVARWANPRGDVLAAAAAAGVGRGRAGAGCAWGGRFTQGTRRWARRNGPEGRA
ncbi:hypothetical protein B0H15DRAFT_795103 [Mycena belliarum]|uniref:Uncharacterized protein n=1 Tax=Mycena belliarum TaxID=1033014 RepID=A0AAD6UIY6_9AGAR|nr:hypothetical protein B0H15DRAFT_804922 [Mycena belliae]KAJ7104330.1 hypothetical protein B0H15DRAFT_795103 [Mycena belliae]